MFIFVTCDVSPFAGFAWFLARAVLNLCNVKSCVNTSNNEILTDKRGDFPCVNISKHTCPVVK